MTLRLIALLDAHRTADLLNFRNQTVENATLGVGAWHPNREDGTLRYRNLVPFFEKWSPRLDLFVSDLVMRWMNFTGTGIAQTLDRDPGGCLGNSLCDHAGRQGQDLGETSSLARREAHVG